VTPEDSVSAVVAPWFRMGYIIPHLHVDMDAFQFYRVAPIGAMLVTTSLDLRGYSPSDVERETNKIDNVVDILTEADVDFISLSGVPIGAALGHERVAQLLGKMESRSGLRCSTDIEAHVKALEHLGVERVAVATRWPDDVVSGVRGYLADAGIAVVSTVSRARSLEENKRADAASDHRLALELGRQAVEQAPNAEALLMPGGLWFAIHAAAALESDLGIPVLLNITSTLWDALRSRRTPLPHRPDPVWGRLLASL
jgi:maleate cis-trans isomerase